MTRPPSAVEERRTLQLNTTATTSGRFGQIVYKNVEFWVAAVEKNEEKQTQKKEKKMRWNGGEEKQTMMMRRKRKINTSDEDEKKEKDKYLMNK